MLLYGVISGLQKVALLLKFVFLFFKELHCYVSRI